MDDSRSRRGAPGQRPERHRPLPLLADRHRASPRCLFVITDYYTSTRFRPVKKTPRASQTGHATNIIQGLAQGLQATALPALSSSLGILGGTRQRRLAGIYGIGVAVMAQLSLTGLIVALDAFGPITDNAGGIAEMADLPEEVRNVTDPLDAVGNTTKAVTKGYAIGSAVLAALVLFAGFQQELRDAGGPRRVNFDDRRPAGARSGLLIGGMMVYLFASLAIEAVGRAGGAGRRGGAPPVPREPGDHGGHRAARVRPRVDIVTAAAQREMILPALIPIGITADRRHPDRRQALGGLLIGVIVVGLLLRRLDDRRAAARGTTRRS